jgi:hypothetical protein
MRCETEKGGYAMLPGILLWLMGVPLVVIVILYLLF